MIKLKKLTNKILPILLSILIVLIPFGIYNPTFVNATGVLSTASNQLSNPIPSQGTVSYTTVFTVATATAIKCIDIIFSDTTAQITLTANPATTAPAGITTTAATKTSLSGAGLVGTWTLYNTTSGILQYENTSGESPTANAVTVVTGAITNPSASTFYAQIATYSTLTGHNCSGLVDNSNVMAQVTTAGVLANVTVDPTLSFSVADYQTAVNGGPAATITTTSSTIPFGTVAAGATAAGGQILTVSTNAAHGYTVYIRDTQLLTNANTDTIADTTGTNTSPAAFTTNTFGYIEDGPGETQFTNNTWAKLDTTNRAIATRAGAYNSDAFHVGYKVQVSSTQPPGTYQTTIYYTAVPVY